MGVNILGVSENILGCCSGHWRSWTVTFVVVMTDILTVGDRLSPLRQGRRNFVGRTRELGTDLTTKGITGSANVHTSTDPNVTNFIRGRHLDLCRNGIMLKILNVNLIHHECDLKLAGSCDGDR